MTAENLMNTLNCSKADALDIIAQDKAIDKGANPFPLTKEQEQVSKKMRGVGRAPTAYKFTKRERKPSKAKQDLIDLLSNCLLANGASYVGINNPEREFSFIYDNVTYKITMSVPRK